MAGSGAFTVLRADTWVTEGTGLAAGACFPENPLDACVPPLPRAAERRPYSVALPTQNAIQLS
jgi:hypothetical protein